ncbi:MAG: hypothetical protein ACYC1M_03470 [Armatimonadota bacterium]
MRRYLDNHIFVGALSLAAYFIYKVFIPLLPIPSGMLPFAAAGSSLIFMFLTIWLLLRVVLVRTSALAEAITLGVSIVLTFLILNLPMPAVRILASTKLGIPCALAFRDIFILLSAAHLGKLVSRVFREPNIVPPVALFLASIDIFIVKYWLPVYMKHTPDLLPQVAVSVPMVGSAAKAGHVALMGLIGPADFMFFSAFLACCVRFKLNTQLTATWTTVVLTVFLLLQFTLSPVIPLLAMLPGLVPIAATFLIVNHKQFRLSQAEWRDIGIAAIIVIVIMTVLAHFVLN